MNIKRIAATALAPIFVVIGYWLAGFDFDTRGFMATYCYIFCLIAAALVWCFPTWGRS